MEAVKAGTALRPASTRATRRSRAARRARGLRPHRRDGVGHRRPRHHLHRPHQPRQPHARSSARSSRRTPAASSRCCRTRRATSARSTSSQVRAIAENGPDVDWDRLADVVHRGVRFLDDVIEVNEYPLPQIGELARGNRKIGLGVMGWADMLIKLGIAYDSDEAVALGEKVMGFIDAEAQVRLAQARRGARRRSRTSRARSTTRPRAARCATRRSRRSRRPARSRSSPTARPASSRCSRCRYVRTVMDNDRLVEVNPLFEDDRRQARLLQPRAHGADRRPRLGARHRRGARGRAARRSSPRTTSRPSGTSGCRRRSRSTPTTRCPRRSTSRNEATVEDVRHVYDLAYELGVKGVTIYRDGSKEGQVLTTGKTRQGRREPTEAAARHGEIEPRPRPSGHRRPHREDPDGLRQPLRHDQLGRARACARSSPRWASPAAARRRSPRRCRGLISVSLRAGVDPEAIIKHLRGIRCPSPVRGPRAARCSRAPTPSASCWSTRCSSSRPGEAAQRRVSKHTDTLDNLVGRLPRVRRLARARERLRGVPRRAATASARSVALANDAAARALARAERVGGVRHGSLGPHHQAQLAAGRISRRAAATRTTSSRRASTCTSARDFQVFRNSRYPYIDPASRAAGLMERVDGLGRGAVRAAPRGVRRWARRSSASRCPTTSSARLEGKSSLGRLGLLIHSTAGYVDPGWEGTLTLELSNVANLPIVLTPGHDDRADLVLADDDAGRPPVRAPGAGQQVPGAGRRDAEQDAPEPARRRPCGSWALGAGRLPSDGRWAARGPW